jgi:hypothetical protein
LASFPKSAPPGIGSEAFGLVVDIFFLPNKLLNLPVAFLVISCP